MFASCELRLRVRARILLPLKWEWVLPYRDVDAVIREDEGGVGGSELSGGHRCCVVERDVVTRCLLRFFAGT